MVLYLNVLLCSVCDVLFCRYPLYRSFYTGRVTIYCDGSVLLSHAGVEIGQVRGAWWW
jgi:hypothetical protein